MDPDPGGPKTYGSYGSGFGSATLRNTLQFFWDNVFSSRDPGSNLIQLKVNPDPG
jgi:hypothetical protein